MSREVIIAAPQVLHSFFNEQFPDWDCQIPCESIEDIWNGLSEGKLSADSSIVMFCDTLYEEDPDAFAQAVAEFAPNALVLILSYNPNLQDEISSDVHAQLANIEYRKQYGRNVPLEFIPQETAVVSIDEAIDFYENEAQAVSDFQNTNNAVNIEVDELGSSHHKFNRNGKVITVTSSKGGSGKSTVALLAASTMALSSQKAYDQGLIEEPLRVCLVDLDTFDGQIGFVLNQSVPTSLSIALANIPPDEELVWKNLVYSERMGFHSLLAPVRGVTARYTDARFYTQIITLLKSMFDVVILDTSVQHYDEIIKRVALPMADAILLITTLDIKSVKGLARWMKVAAEAPEDGGHGLNMDKVGIVVNGSIFNVGMGNEELTAAAMGAKLLVSIPLDTTAVIAAGNAGRLEEIVKTHPSISASYHKLATMMSGLLGKAKFVPILESDEDEELIIKPGSGKTSSNSAPTTGRGKSRGFFSSKKR